MSTDPQTRSDSAGGWRDDPDQAPVNELVLIVYDGRVRMAKRLESGAWRAETGYTFLIDPTLWQPAPQVPQ